MSDTIEKLSRAAFDRAWGEWWDKRKTPQQLADNLWEALVTESTRREPIELWGVVHTENPETVIVRYSKADAEKFALGLDRARIVKLREVEEPK